MYTFQISYPRINGLRLTHDMRVQVPGDGHVDGLVELGHKGRRDLGNRVCPNTSLTEAQLAADPARPASHAPGNTPSAAFCCLS